MNIKDFRIGLFLFVLDNVRPPYMCQCQMKTIPYFSVNSLSHGFGCPEQSGSHGVAFQYPPNMPISPIWETPQILSNLFNSLLLFSLFLSLSQEAAICLHGKWNKTKRKKLGICKSLLSSLILPWMESLHIYLFMTTHVHLHLKTSIGWEVSLKALFAVIRSQTI